MQLFLNNWAARLASPLSSTALALQIPAEAAALLVGLGAGDHYLLTLVAVDDAGAETAWEIVRATDVIGGSVTIERAQEGTVAAEWPVNSLLEVRLTAGVLSAIRDAAEAAVQPGELAEVATSGAYADLIGKPNIPSTPAEVGAATAAQGAKADTAVQPGSLAAVATSGAYADLGGKPFIPAAPGDIGAASAAQGDLADTAVQPAALISALDAKVDKQTGYGLSQNSFTDAEKAKLASLDEAHYKGTHVNLAALQTAWPTAAAGDYADVDAGVSDPVLRYIWDVSDAEWVPQAGSADPVTAAQVKALYESNADTNAYTDAEKTKLVGVATDATANPDTDSLAEGATNLYHTGARVRAVVLTGLSLADSAIVAATDTVLQAIGKLAARVALAFDRANHTGSQAISTVSGLQTALDGKASVSALPPMTVACSDETTAITVGNGKVTFRAPGARTLLGVRASLTTAQTSGSLVTIDLKVNGVSALSTKVTIDNGEKTSVTAAIAAVISSAAIADDAEISLDVTQIGDGTAKGLKVTLYWSAA